MEMPCINETELAVQPQRRTVVGVDAAHYHVFAERFGFGEEGKDEQGADTLASMLCMNVNAMFNRRRVAGKGAKLSEAGKTQDFSVAPSDQDRKPLRRASSPPLPAVMEIDRALRVYGGRCQDDVIINVQDQRQIRFIEVGDLDG